MESIFFMGGGMAICAVITTVGRFVLAALLGAKVFGNFAIALAMVGFMNLFANTMGDRFLVVTKVDREKALNTVFTIEMIVWVSVVVLWCISSPFFWARIGKGASWGISSILLLQGVAFPLSRPRALLERSLNFKLISIVNVFTNALCMGTALILALYIKNELPLIVFSLLSLLQAVVFLRISKIRPRLRIDHGILKEYIHLCWPLMGAAFLVFIYWNFEKILLDQYVDREHLGYYAWAFSLGILVLRVKDVVARVLFPVFAKLIRDGNEEHFRKGFASLYRLLVVLYGFFVPALFVLSPRLVRLAGAEWLPAIPCLQIAILIFAMRTFNSFLEPAFVTHGKPRVLMYLSAVNCVVIMGGGYYALRYFPFIETMAAVVLLSCLFTFVVCAVLIRRICRVSLFRIVLPGLLMATLSGLIMHGVTHFAGGGLFALGSGILIGAVFFAGYVWKSSMDLFAMIKGQLFPGKAKA